MMSPINHETLLSTEKQHKEPSTISGQPHTMSSVVSTCTCNSPTHSALTSTRNPCNPSIPAAVSCCAAWLHSSG